MWLLALAGSFDPNPVEYFHLRWPHAGLSAAGADSSPGVGIQAPVVGVLPVVRVDGNLHVPTAAVLKEDDEAGGGLGVGRWRLNERTNPPFADLGDGVGLSLRSHHQISLRGAFAEPKVSSRKVLHPPVDWAAVLVRHVGELDPVAGLEMGKEAEIRVAAEDQQLPDRALLGVGDGQFHRIDVELVVAAHADHVGAQDLDRAHGDGHGVLLGRGVARGGRAAGEGGARKRHGDGDGDEQPHDVSKPLHDSPPQELAFLGAGYCPETDIVLPCTHQARSQILVRGKVLFFRRRNKSHRKIMMLY